MITYLTGDATDPQVAGNKIIAHVCNNVGGWGRGFVLSLSKRWPEAEKQYREWFVNQPSMLLMLGDVQFVPVHHDGAPPDWTRTFVANMVAQHGVQPINRIPPIRYNALERCLEEVSSFAKHLGGASIHMPRIGCGLAGGRWHEVEPIILRAIPDTPVYVYDFVAGGPETVAWKK